jgi:predicted P-loop ATPase
VKKFDIEAIRRDRDQLWAEAVHRWNQRQTAAAVSYDMEAACSA